LNNTNVPERPQGERSAKSVATDQAGDKAIGTSRLHNIEGTYPLEDSRLRLHDASVTIARDQCSCRKILESARKLAGTQSEAKRLLAQAEKEVRKREPAEARTQLRGWLREVAESVDLSGSLSEMISELGKGAMRDKRIPPVLLRYLAENDVIQVDGWKNDVQRSIVQICEGATPELCKFLKVDGKKQTFEKFSTLEGAHSTFCNLLDPIRSTYGDLDALQDSREAVLAPFKHGQIRAYCTPFGFNEIKVGLEEVFSKLKKVTNPTASFLEDFDECKKAIEQCRVDASEIGSFLSHDFIIPFVDTVDRLLENYTSVMRSKFQVEIKSNWPSSGLQKRHPLHEAEREFTLAFPLRNDGPGMAMEVRAEIILESDCIFLETPSISLGNLTPGDFSLVVNSMVVTPTKSFSGIVTVEWVEVGDPATKKKTFDFSVSAQASDIDWNKLTYWTPYSTEVAKGQNFIGRVEQVQHLASKLLRTPMEPFYITGQKRVGKTSLVRAATTFAEENAPNQEIKNHFILWGDVAHADSSTAMQQLGETIEEFVTDQMNGEFANPKLNYSGSLSPLLKVFDAAQRIDPTIKFVITIDEFDEIHQDLYLHGNLAETFFANLRSISRRDNVCLVLVGGENMSYVMSRQGQKLNNFTRVSLSYFSRDEEWLDFQEMVRRPSAGKLSWHEDAISEVFNISNGNPYYAKLVCAGVARRAISDRDADITRCEVSMASQEQLSSLGSNSFAHLWQDGIPKAPEDREPDILRRSRVLVAAARCLRDRAYLTLENLVARKVSPDLTSVEVQSVLNDLHMRQIISEKSDEYSFTLPIFSGWLADVGASELVSDTLSEELAQSTLAEENAAMVRSDEVVNLARSWPTYRGKAIGVDDIRAWYQQVKEIKSQRILFELLKKVKIFSENQIRERLEDAHTFVRRSIPPEIQKTKNQRRNDIAVVYVDGEGKSGSTYAAMYAEQNRISAKAVFSSTSFSKNIAPHIEANGPPKAIVVIDDIAATGNSLEGNVRSFISDHAEFFENAILRVISLVATRTAYDRLTEAFQEFEIDADFRSCEVVGDEHRAFPENKGGWGTEDDWYRAKALCEELGAYVYPNSPLGYDNLGLLIVFPTTVPNNSLPILHSNSKSRSDKKWNPLFLRITH